MVKTLYDDSCIRFYDTVIINLDKHYCYLPTGFACRGGKCLGVVRDDRGEGPILKNFDKDP